MSEVVVATPRVGKFNKNAAHRVRFTSSKPPKPTGKIPAVLYGQGHDPVAVEVDTKQISKILFSETGHNTIFDVEVKGQKAAKAMIVDWQREPLNDLLIHIDMKRIALDKALRVKVRIKLLGVPVGVKTSGGILDQVLREVEIECLPADIPSHIDVDVSHLELHGVLRVGGLPHSEKIKYLNHEDATVAHVVTIREEAPTAAETEAAATAAAAAEGAAAEPEVAKKGGKPEDAAKKTDAAAKKPEAKK
jgi:large subunit ribosomal protein L25